MYRGSLPVHSGSQGTNGSNLAPPIFRSAKGEYKCQLCHSVPVGTNESILFLLSEKNHQVSLHLKERIES